MMDRSGTHAALNILHHTRWRWLITGVAGFIGSNLLETLLACDQEVVGLDNFTTGHRHNLQQVAQQVTPAQWQRFTLIEGDIRNPGDLARACRDVDYVLHHAAAISVPGSIADPLTTHAINETGFLNLLLACRDAKVKRIVYASSSAVYGDHAGVPAVEQAVGNPLSPYGLSKASNEHQAALWSSLYGLETIGLRYFNVFGKRQDPQGAYAAVIPKWITTMLKHLPITIFGDGKTSRDFCAVENVVQANLLAATVTDPAAIGQVYNIATGQPTTLTDLYQLLDKTLAQLQPSYRPIPPQYEAFRTGDIRYSQADITKAQSLLHYRPAFATVEGIAATLSWYLDGYTPTPRADV